MKNITINYPEMWGDSIAEIQAENTCIGNRPYRVTSREPLPILRGVEACGRVAEFGANMTKNKRFGWFKYYMTKKAFEKLTETRAVELNCLLD